jgi:RNA methyltransferase, TrmH family
LLSSVKNPKVAAAARLRKGSFREADGRFLVEGAQGIREALGVPGSLESLFTTDEQDVLALHAREAGIEVSVVSEAVMGRLTSTVTPQGVVGVAPFLDVGLGSLPPGGSICLLHEVRDPGNAGTVLRSADACGAAGVVFSSSSVDLYNPKTVRASAGSLFHLPVVRGLDTAEVIEHSHARGHRVLAMSALGEQDLYGADLSDPVTFVFGNEARGLPDDVLRLADQVVRVPIQGKAESLNLAAAATVCLFEWSRRHARRSEALESIIAAAAHDIRSPLTAMKGFGYALEKRWAQMTDEQRSIMLSGIVHDADRMDTIVRQLLDAARVVGGNLELFPEDTDVPELVLSVAELQRRDPDRPEVQWVGRADRFFCDPARLKTTLISFVDALVWWADDGPIRVDAARRGELLWMSASRAGADLTAEEADALFAARREGTGGGSKIGLFVARGVAEAQGGTAWGTVRDGRLEFHLELPVG